MKMLNEIKLIKKRCTNSGITEEMERSGHIDWIKNYKIIKIITNYYYHYYKVEETKGHFIDLIWFEKIK